MTYITDILNNNVALNGANLQALQAEAAAGQGAGVQNAQDAQNNAAPGGVAPQTVAGATENQAPGNRILPSDLVDAMNDLSELTGVAMMLDDGIERRDAKTINLALKELDLLYAQAKACGEAHRIPKELMYLGEQARAEMDSPEGLKRLAENVALKGLVLAERSGNLDDIKAALARIEANQARDGDASLLTNELTRTARARVFNAEVQTGTHEAIQKGITERARVDTQLVDTKTQMMLDGAVFTALEQALCGLEAPTIAETLPQLYTLCGAAEAQNAAGIENLEEGLNALRELFRNGTEGNFAETVKSAITNLKANVADTPVEGFLTVLLETVQETANAIQAAQTQLQEALTKSDVEQLKTALEALENLPQGPISDKKALLDAVRVVVKYVNTEQNFDALFKLGRAINDKNYQELATCVATLKDRAGDKPGPVEAKLLHLGEVMHASHEALTHLAEGPLSPKMLSLLTDAYETAQLSESATRRKEALHFIVTAHRALNLPLETLQAPVQALYQADMAGALGDIEKHIAQAEGMDAANDAVAPENDAQGENREARQMRLRQRCTNSLHALESALRPVTLDDLRALVALLPEGTIDTIDHVLALPGMGAVEQGAAAADAAGMGALEEVVIPVTPEELEAMWQVNHGPLFGVNSMEVEDPEKREAILRAMNRCESAIDSAEANEANDANKANEANESLAALRFLSLSFALVRDINAETAKTQARELMDTLKAPELNAAKFDRVREALQPEREKVAALELLTRHAGTPQARQAARALLADGPGIGAALYNELHRELIKKAAQYAAEQLFGVPGTATEGQVPEEVQTLQGVFAHLDLAHLSLEEFVSTFTELMTGMDAAERGTVLEKFKTLNETLATGAPETPEMRLNVLDAVNSLFDGTPQAFTDAPLHLKEAFLADDPEFAQAEHSLRLAKSQLIANLTSDVTAKTRSALTNVAARGSVDTATLRQLITEHAQIKAHNFEIANYLLLERAALARGAVREADLVEPDTTGEGWVEKLKLPQWTKDYIEDLAPQLQPDTTGLSDNNRIAWNRLAVAAQTYARNGTSGGAMFGGVEERIHVVHNRGVLTGSKDLFKRIPGWNEAVMLDRLIVDLTGLVRTEDRLEGNSRLSFKSHVIDANMRAVVADLDMMLSTEREELSQLEMKNKTAREAIAQYGGLFEKKATILTYLGAEERTVARLETIKKTVNARTQKMETLKGALKFAWPIGGQRTEQRQIARDVLEFSRLFEEFKKIEHDERPEVQTHRERVLSSLNDLRTQLARVNPKTMRFMSEKDAQKAAENEDRDMDRFITEELLPRADALAYFDRTIMGSKKSRASVDAERFSIAAKNLNALSSRLEKTRKAFNDTIRDDIHKQVYGVTLAAFLKVTCDSPEASISLSVPSQRQAVIDQLESWGVPTEDPVFSRMVEAALLDMTLPDGNLKEKVLKEGFFKKVEAWLTGSSHKLFRGKLGDAAYKAEMRAKGDNFAARRRAFQEAYAPEAATRREGRERMLDLALQGNNVTYSKTSGINIDTNAFFMPWSKEDDPFYSTNLTGPLSLQFKHLERGSMSLSKLPGPGDAYQVIVKPEDFDRIGAALSISTPLQRLSFKVGAGYSHESIDGVALTFPDRQSCKNFLDMEMQSDASPKDIKRYRDSILAASQIRLIDEHGNGGDFTAACILTALKVQIPFTKLTLAATGTLALTGNLKTSSSVETNALGSTVVSKWSGAASLSAAAKLANSSTSRLDEDLVKKHTMGTKKIGISSAVTNETRIVTDATGVSSASTQRLTFTMPGTERELKLFRESVLPYVMGNQFADQPEERANFQAFLSELQPGDTLTRVSTLTEAARAAAQQALHAAQLTGDTSSEAAQAQIAEAGRILNASESFEPTKFLITTQKRQSMSSISPGLLITQVVRNKALTTSRVKAQFEVPPATN